MKIKAQIEALESLAELDAELKILDEELSQERTALGEKKDQLQQLEEQIAKSVASIGEMDRARGDVMQEARQMSAQMERSREKLARCRTEREVNAAQREIEELRKLYRDREQEVEKLGGLADQARVEMDSRTSERDALLGVLGASEGEVATKLSSLEGTASERRALRKALVDKVQPTLYRRYELIRKRRGSAIAHVTEGICSACNMQIVPMMFQQLMRGDEFQQCPSCNRILYYRPPEGEADSAETQSSGP